MHKIFFTLLFVVSAYAKLIDGVAINVKGEAITLYEIKKEMDFNRVDADKASSTLVRQKLEACETKERNINVSSDEVYNDIKMLAHGNNMSVSEFYIAARETNNISSSELKKKIKDKLLSQKLYSQIAYTQMKQPSDEDVQEYFNLHKSAFSHPSGFNVVVYSSQDINKLQEKINNPMFYSPDVTSTEQTLVYTEISPELANILSKTPAGTFTTAIPDGQGNTLSFYVKDVLEMQELNMESSKQQIKNIIMSKKREQVLNDYFARLKTNADIKYLRKP